MTARSKTGAAIDAGTTRAEVLAHPLWYHTLELGPGLVTPGWFDLRAVVDRMPWPDVSGKRCLDVGTWDGFIAFELERRGASEVIATDISDPTEWDWAARDRIAGPAAVAAEAGQKNGVGFELAKRVLGSSVERREINVYDLSPEELGTFDVVVCGSLMLHLREPVRALEAIRSVCAGKFLSSEQIRLDLTALHPRRPVAGFLRGENCQWWVPNVAAHREMVAAAGFVVESTGRPYAIPLGAGHPALDEPVGRRDAILSRALAGGQGIAHHALLAAPDPTVPGPV